MARNIFKILITTLIIDKYFCEILDRELLYPTTKRERKNVVNKSVWFRPSSDGSLADHHPSFFTLDVEQQNYYDTLNSRTRFGSGPLSQYMYRRKRAASSGQVSTTTDDYENINLANSKLIDSLKMLQDYPYDTAIYLNNNIIDDDDNNDTIHDVNLNSNQTEHKEIKDTSNDSAKNGTQKRSMLYDPESESIKHFESTYDKNKTGDSREIIDNKLNRNVFDKSNAEWTPSAPFPDINVYRVVPKEPMQKAKQVSERGLIKVIAILTKSFKKIMKQHSEITDIHSKINEINDDFTKTLSTISAKFHEFDLKYLYLVKLQDKIKDFSAKMEAQEETIRNKELEISKSFIEFENQQKKFLVQQKQFYNMQKLMLAQNEKINVKQSLIAKTQNEISHRQNSFAKILKKAKQMYLDRQILQTTTRPYFDVKNRDSTMLPLEPEYAQSTQTPKIDTTIHPVKMDLYNLNRILDDPDEMILREKDNQPVDDLVYKYYFNNTFIDSVMQKHILNSFVSNQKKPATPKNKRYELENTLLLPIENNKDLNSFEETNRVRRWINNHSKHNKRRNRGKNPLANNANADEKHLDKINDNSEGDIPAAQPKRYYSGSHLTNDPFLTMALNFCHEIGENKTNQGLNWCVEKSLRRLQFLEANQQQTQTTMKVNKIKQYIKHEMPKVFPKRKTMKEPGTEPSTTVSMSSTSDTPIIVAEPTSKPTSPSVTTRKTVSYSHKKKKKKKNTYRFGYKIPENELLEFNLKALRTITELPPLDTEGNVYFDGSLHESDIIDNDK